MELNEKDYAPVFIPTLCRYEHFKRCVDSLSRCIGANNTTLIIGLDFPLKMEHWEGYQKIKAYIPAISGLKKIDVIERTENYGALKNVVEAQKYIFERYETCIYSEDDNEFSPNFLQYINKGLILYKNDPYVIAISGYVYPYAKEIDKGNAFKGIGFSAWGVGEWKNKRISLKVDDVNCFAEGVLKSWSKSFKIFRKSPKSINSLMTMHTNHLVWGDSIILDNCILYGYHCIFPVISKVRNWGNDGSGLHSRRSTTDPMIEEIDDHEDFDFDIANDKPIYFTQFVKNVNVLEMIVILIRYIIYRYIGIDILQNYYKHRDV